MCSKILLQNDVEVRSKRLPQSFLPGWLAGAETFLEKRGGQWYAGSQVSKLYSQQGSLCDTVQS